MKTWTFQVEVYDKGTWPNKQECLLDLRRFLKGQPMQYAPGRPFEYQPKPKERD